jgi:hypothetical protein
VVAIGYGGPEGCNALTLTSTLRRAPDLAVLLNRYVVVTEDAANADAFKVVNYEALKLITLHYTALTHRLIMRSIAYRFIIIRGKYRCNQELIEGSLWGRVFGPCHGPSPNVSLRAVPQ